MLITPLLRDLINNSNKEQSQYKKMNSTVMVGPGMYDTYSKDGKYYYKKDGKYVEITDKYVASKVAENKKTTISPQSSSVAGGLAGAVTGAVSAITDAVNKSNSSAKSGGSGGGGGSTGSYNGGRVNDAYYEKMLNDVKKQLDELKNPKVWTAAELAKLHDVEDQYNYDKILQKYNDATNQYYTDAVANQIMNNTNAERSNSVYANRLINDYLSSYNTAAPTAVGKGTRAANALSSNIYADLTNEETSSNLQSIVNSYLENQKNELANNPILARQEYNNMGNMLLQLGANYNTSEVQNYINALNAYDTAYAGIRNAQNNLASTAAAAYQNNANAALANNAYNASKSSGDMLRRAYQIKYGNEWEKAYNNDKRDVSQTYTQTYNYD